MTSERQPLVPWTIASILALAATLTVIAAPAALVPAGACIAALAAVAAVVVQPRWALLVLFFCGYTYAFEAADAQFSMPVSFKAAAALVVGAAVLRALSDGEALGVPRRFVWLLLGFFAVQGLATVFAGDQGAALERIRHLIDPALLALVIAVLLHEPRWLRRLMWVVAGAGAFVSALALLQQLTHAYAATFAGFASIKFDQGTARSAGPIGEPNYFAQALVLSAVLAIYLALRARASGERGAAVAVALLCLGGIGVSYSRGGALALGVCVLLIAVLRSRRPAIALASLALAIAAVIAVLPSSLQKRIESVTQVTDVQSGDFTDLSAKGRFAENLAALHMFADHPLIGVGPANYEVRYDDYAAFVGIDRRTGREPHNLYLEALAEEGVLGGAMLVALIATSLVGAWRARRRAAPADALLAEAAFVGLVGVLVTSVFLHTAVPRYIWLAYGLTWAASMMARSRRAS